MICAVCSFLPFFCAGVERCGANNWPPRCLTGAAGLQCSGGRAGENARRYSQGSGRHECRPLPQGEHRKNGLLVGGWCWGYWTFSPRCQESSFCYKCKHVLDQRQRERAIQRERAVEGCCLCVCVCIQLHTSGIWWTIHWGRMVHICQVMGDTLSCACTLMSDGGSYVDMHLYTSVRWCTLQLDDGQYIEVHLYTSVTWWTKRWGTPVHFSHMMDNTLRCTCTPVTWWIIHWGALVHFSHMMGDTLRCACTLLSDDRW